MSQSSSLQKPSHPGEDPNSAYSMLRQFQAGTAPKTTPANATSSMPPNIHMEPNTPSKFTTPQQYAPPLLPPGTHMPLLAPQSTPTQLLLSPDSITREMIIERIYNLLQDKLPKWSHPTAINDLARRLAFVLIDFGRRGGFGPHGLSRLSDIFMSVGHEGTKHYMALTVNPGVGDVQLLLKGDLREKDGKDPLHDKELMEMLRDGFDQEAVRQWISLLSKTARQSGR
ncbi:Nn.00g103650.m01.CDS01 [Neocucurbitaria sp. VM-36]